MPNDDPARELGELLLWHKQRSGRSYEQLARKTFISRSSLHRYCSGKAVPGTFATVERIAQACDAAGEQLDELYRVWKRATRGKKLSRIRCRSRG